MPIQVIPLLPRQRDPGSEFGYAKPLPKEVPSVFLVQPPSCRQVTFQTHAAAHRYAAEYVFVELGRRNLDCSGSCGCGWQEAVEYQEKKEAFARAGLQLPYPKDCEAPECTCAACFNPAEVGCDADLETSTRLVLRIRTLMQQDNYAGVCIQWDTYWGDYYEKNGRDYDDVDARVPIWFVPNA